MESHDAGATRPSMSLADPSLDDSQGIKLVVVFNPADAEKLFQGSGHTFQEIADLAKDRKPLPRFPLTASIQATAKMIVKEVDSANVIAKLPGTDPKLKDQYVVLSSHMDHLGIGEPINGDNLYNGAMDNASGSRAESRHRQLARGLARQAGSAQCCSSLSLAEEKGLLGSKYFAAHPTVPKTSMVADINTDMFLPIFPLKILTVYGLAESDFGRHGAASGPEEQVSRCSPILSRCAMRSFAAINTASSGREFRR